MTKKIKLILAAQCMLPAFFLLPFFANSQTKTSSKTLDTLNIGFVLYTKSSTPKETHQPSKP